MQLFRVVLDWLSVVFRQVNRVTMDAALRSLLSACPLGAKTELTPVGLWKSRGGSVAAPATDLTGVQNVRRSAIVQTVTQRVDSWLGELPAADGQSAVLERNGRLPRALTNLFFRQKTIETNNQIEQTNQKIVLLRGVAGASVDGLLKRGW